MQAAADAAAVGGDEAMDSDDAGSDDTQPAGLTTTTNITTAFPENNIFEFFRKNSGKVNHYTGDNRS